MSATAHPAESKLPSPQTSFVNRHCSCWCFSRRTFLVQQRRAGERAKVQSNFGDLQTIPSGYSSSGALFFCPCCITADTAYIFGCAEIQRFGISLGPQLALHLAALHRTVAFAYIAWHLYTERWLTHGRSTYDTVATRLAKSLVSGFFVIGVSGLLVSPGRRHLEFPVQVGTGRHRPRTTRRRPTRCSRRSRFQCRRRADHFEFSPRLAPVFFVPEEMMQRINLNEYSMKQPNIIVVGGGLAGLMATIRVAEAGSSRSTFFHRAGKALALRVRAGRHQRRKKSKRRRRQHRQAFRRHHLRRRFSRQSTARQAHVRSRSRHHRSARSHGRDVQSHSRRPARLSPLRRHSYITAPLLPAPPPASSCSTRSTNKSAATNPKAASQNLKATRFSRPSSTNPGSAAVSAPWICAPWKSPRTPPTQ